MSKSLRSPHHHALHACRLLGFWLMGSVGSAASDPLPFQLHPAFELTLFAQEPEIVDPVALTFAADGRIYVVEMRDYPYGLGPDLKPGGRVKLLEDTDSDGRIDRSRVFADQLSFPTSIAPWKKGVIVAAPPEILYLEDTNQDGRADRREVLLSGFRLGVTDSNANGLRWGLDNFLHGVNGGNGGLVQSHRRPGPPLSIRNQDFAFDPESGRLEPTYHTSGGFGLVFNEWGDSFVTYNIDHIQQRILPVRYLDRFPGLPPFKATISISDHGEMASIYPISVPETRPNHPEQSGHFSAAGGLGYLGGGYPGDLPGSVLVCDVVGNLVHRDLLVRTGPVFQARRASAEQTAEFYASRDSSCRPVGLETGPDGSLYLIDMQRNVIEHPDYIPEKLRLQQDVRAGEDRGRIYRLSVASRRPGPRLVERTGRELVSLLADPNPWWRGTAQRLLVERQDSSVSSDLQEFLRHNPDPLARLHALWTLEGLRAATESDILAALRDVHPGVRRSAVLLAERQSEPSVELRERVLAMADDPAVEARFQVALTLGGFTNKLSGLSLVLRRDLRHSWSRRAVYSSLSPGQETILLRELLQRDGLDEAESGSLLATIEELADLAGARTADSLADFLSLVQRQPGPTLSAALNGLATGLARAPQRPPVDSPTRAALEKLSGRPEAEILAKAWRITKALGLPDNAPQRAALNHALEVVADPTQHLRLESMQLLQLGEYLQVSDTLFGLLTRPEPASLQLAALDVLGQHSEPDLARRLLQTWRTLQPPARPRVVDLLLRKPPFHAPLMDAIESGQVTLGELNLDLEQRRRLLRRSAPDIQARAAKLITDEEYGNRKSLVEEWLSKLPTEGDEQAGRLVFIERCAQCHALNEMGHRVGPDMEAAAHRSVEDLLGNILDPNMAIHPNYVAYSVELKNGEVESGLLHSESADALVLLQSEGKQVVVARREVERMESSGLSLMPEGLEQGLSPQQLRDLIALLQAGRLP